MRTRLFINWRSTLIGLVLLIVSLILVFHRIITFTEFTAFLPTILGLLYVQDTIFKITPKP